MIHVSTRRKIAVAVIVIFLVASGAATLVLTRTYAPGRLAARAQAALAAATGLEWELETPTISVDDTATFPTVRVHSGGRTLLSAGPVKVTGLPSVSGKWLPRSVSLHQVMLYVDPGGEPGFEATLAAVAALEARSQGVQYELPPDVSVDVSYAGKSPVKFAAKSGGLPGGGSLQLEARVESISRDFHLGISQAEMTLSGSLAEAAVAMPSLIDKLHAATRTLGIDLSQGQIAASWKDSHETIELTNEAGWNVSAEAMNEAGLTMNGWEVQATMKSVTVTNGILSAAEGNVAFAAPSMETKRLSAILATIGVKALAEADTPARFENVRMAAEFSWRDAVVSARPPADMPALVWCEVAGQVIKLATGEGQTAVADIQQAVSSGSTPK